MPLPLVSSLFFTIFLIVGILYEPLLPPLPYKQSSKSRPTLIKDKVPLKVASSLKKKNFRKPQNLGDEDSYEVVGGDTLMLIAFKLFGDYRFWKEIANWNREFLGAKTSLDIGMKLKVFSSKEKRTWPPKGNPYLIKTGDFLTRISEKVYGTSKLWKRLFRNNKLMIKDPNLIFSGFTLFYKDISKSLK